MSLQDSPAPPPAKRPLPDRPIVWELLLFVLIFLLLMVLGGVLLSALADVAFGQKAGAALNRGLPNPNDPAESWIYIGTFALIYMAIIASVWLAMFPHSGRRGVALALVPASWRWHVLGSLAVVALSMLLDWLLLPFLEETLAIGGDELQIVLLIRTLTATPDLAIAAVIVLALLAPIAEEFVFRGLLFGWLRGLMPFVVVALVTSAVFGLVHGEWAHAIAAGLLGLPLAFIRERSGSLWPAITAHVVNNLVAVGSVPLGL